MTHPLPESVRTTSVRERSAAVGGRRRLEAVRRARTRCLPELMALEARVVMTAIPTLNSLVGAAATIYLDFDGHYQASWGSYSNITTPTYDQDGNTSSFTDSELASIRQIWEYVAEDYAPFNINVTTVEPPSFNNGEALRVAIGGDSSWLNGTYGGYAYINSFTNSRENVVYVFEDNLGNGTPKYVGDASSHEAGHAFGLRHQSLYDSSGNLVQTYSRGTDGGQTAPIMGTSYYARRGMWWYGTTTSASTYQDDMGLIARSTNGFGYRADDHGNSAGSATPLTVSGTSVSGSGVVATADDLDSFSFSTGAGPVSFTVSTPASVNNLAPRLELRDAGGSTLIVSAGSTSNFSATVSADLAAGSYRLVVSSDGVYGSAGQYFVGGTIIASSDLVNAPSGLAASTVSTSRIDLAWTDNASNEAGYRVERSLDGANWTVLADTLPADSTSFSDTSGSAGTTYSYRVQAFNDATTSDVSNIASATTITDAPAGLTASAVSSSRIDLSWSDVAGETGYRIERSTDGSNWTLAGTTGAGGTTFSDTGRAASTTYVYRVQAVNSGGSSAYSGTASATTLEAALIPDAPTGLTASAVSGTEVALSWDDVNGETGYRVERSHNDGKGWSTVGQVGADTTTFADTSAKAGKTYLYRVYASNDAGESPPSNIASVATPGGGGGGNGGGKGGGKGGGNGGQAIDPPSSLSTRTQIVDESLESGCCCPLCSAVIMSTQPAEPPRQPVVEAAPPKAPWLFVIDPSAHASPAPASSPVVVGSDAGPDAGVVDLVLETRPARRLGLGMEGHRPWWALN